jgi:hypothetical protein
MKGLSVIGSLSMQKVLAIAQLGFEICSNSEPVILLAFSHHFISVRLVTVVFTVIFA